MASVARLIGESDSGGRGMAVGVGGLEGCDFAAGVARRIWESDPGGECGGFLCCTPCLTCPCRRRRRKTQAPYQSPILPCCGRFRPITLKILLPSPRTFAADSFILISIKIRLSSPKTPFRLVSIKIPLLKTSFHLILINILSPRSVRTPMLAPPPLFCSPPP
ncbi:hypothetical protein ACFX1Z_044970 [Malus domestica]